MSHNINSVNSIKTSSTSDIALTLSSIASSPSDRDVLCIDAAGDAKLIQPGKNQVGQLALSVITISGGWGGTAVLTDDTSLRIRGASALSKEDSSLVTKQTVGGAGFITGWTLVAGQYLFILNQAVDTNSGGSCNAQLYDVTNSQYIGPKVRFEEGRFSTTLVYYADISSNTLYEYRVRDVSGTCRLLNETTMFSCTIQIFKV